MNDRLKAFASEPGLQYLLAHDPSVLDRAESLAQTVKLAELRRMVLNMTFDPQSAPLILPGASDAASLKVLIETYDPKWLALYLLEARASDSSTVHNTPQAAKEPLPPPATPARPPSTGYPMDDVPFNECLPC